MSRNVRIAIAAFALSAFMSSASNAFTESGRFLIAHEHHQDDKATTEKDVCPVSGEEISKETNITYDYKGKTYRFCCPDCVAEFKKKPEKYIQKIKERDKKNS